MKNKTCDKCKAPFVTELTTQKCPKCWNDQYFKKGFKKLLKQLVISDINIKLIDGK
jgi:RNA polymerase subunit RPABC4/transcription elongation factor Spt4